MVVGVGELLEQGPLLGLKWYCKPTSGFFFFVALPSAILNPYFECTEPNINI